MSAFTKKYFNLVLSLSALVACVLVGLGGYVRGTGAGLSCPDWPLCFGRAVPPSFGNGVFQEVVHRYIASILSIGIIFISTLILLKKVKLKPRIAYILLIILSLQIILGGLTVLLKLNPFIVTSHLALGTILLQILVSTMIEIKYPNSKISSVTTQKNSKLLVVFGFLVFTQLLVGGFVGSSGSALACPDLPFCGLEIHGQQVLHMFHRIYGLSILTLLALASIVVKTPSVKFYLLRGLGLILVQIIVGGLLIIYKIPVFLSVFHLLIAESIILLFVIGIKRHFPSFRSIN